MMRSTRTEQECAAFAARKRLSPPMTEAERFRRQWLTKMGASPQEIDESVRDVPPRDADLERQELAAIEWIQRERR